METDEQDDGFHKLSETQISTLVTIGSISGFLSILGSLGIIIMLYLRGDKKRLYHRILFAMSSCDIIFSIQAMVGPLPVPKDSGYPGAIGNTTTCTIAGFMMHMGIATSLYNFWLMFTFLSIVRYGQKEIDIAQRYEKFIHASCLVVPFIEGIVLVVTRSFNTTPNYPRCYISAAPAGCDVLDDVECTHGQHSILFFLFFVGIKLIIFVPFLFVAVFLIWWTVRQNDRQNSQVFTHNIRNINRTVASQSILYGIVFFNTYIWIMIVPILGLTLGPSAGGPTFRLFARFMSLIFYPLQGFLNLIIFCKPRFSKIRTNRMDKSVFWVIKETIFGLPMDNARYSVAGATAQSRIATGTGSQISAARSFRSYRPGYYPNNFRPPRFTRSTNDNTNRRTASFDLESKDDNDDINESTGSFASSSSRMDEMYDDEEEEKEKSEKEYTEGKRQLEQIIEEEKESTISEKDCNDKNTTTTTTKT